MAPLYRETKIRTALKSFIWRVLAIFNSFTVLALDISESALKNALMMNISGFIIYFFYERACDIVEWGKEQRYT